MSPGTQAQHWTKEISARDANLHPDVMNKNMSPLQSEGRATGPWRANRPATTLLTDPNGGQTRYSVEGGSTYGNEHKFADRHLIREIADRMMRDNPNLDPKDVAVEAGREARWRMTGDPGPGPSGEPGPGPGLRAAGTTFNVAATAGVIGHAMKEAHEGNPVGAATTLGVGGVALMLVKRFPALAPLAIAHSTISSYDKTIEEKAFADGDWVAERTNPIIGGLASSASATGRSLFEGTFGSIGRGIGEGAAVAYIRATSDEYTFVPWKSQLWSDIFN